jgi:polysaccharide deacetylase family protein (PEP-CTERM system associated)
MIATSSRSGQFHRIPVFSVDVEDWSQSTWDHSLPIGDRAETNTVRMLGLLTEVQARATMFVLGKFAERFPAVVRQIHAAGHEVASHGYGHVQVFRQTRAEFVADIKRAKDLLEQIIGEPVVGYRAPDFSIVNDTTWALEALAEAGFLYDSSVFPIRHSRYGIEGWPSEPARVRTPGGLEIAELPIATIKGLGRNWPLGGGGYHRLMPGIVFRLLASVAINNSPLFMFYCHPYEIDPDEFRESSIQVPLRVRLHQGLGRGRSQRRLSAFLQRFGSQTAVDFLLNSDRAAFATVTVPVFSTSTLQKNGNF